VALLPLFVCAIRFADRWPWRWLNGAVIRRWGVLSYTMYLFHALTIDQVRAGFRAVGLLGASPSFVRLALVDVVALGVTYGIAEAMNRWIEVPCARLRRRLSRVG
jgi:peptidoglycan/LPS O-acetylase OafA/YrhL